MQHLGRTAPESSDELIAPKMLILTYLAIIIVSSAILWPLFARLIH